jgi:hypothetical protein
VLLSLGILRIVYIVNVILAKTPATVTEIDNKATEYVLALATLGDATRNRNNPICVAQLNASTMMSVAFCCRRCYHDKLCQCKQSFKKWRQNNRILEYKMFCKFEIETLICKETIKLEKRA